MRKIVLLLLLVLAALGGGAFVWLTQPLEVPEETFVEISHGTSTRAIGQQLKDAGVLRSGYALLALRALHPSSHLQAGEYAFEGSLTPLQVFDKIRLGQVFYEEITVPEGSNIFDIAVLLDKTDTIKSADFLIAAKDASLIKDLDAAAPTLEGYLFPSTYRVTHRTTAKELCRMMTMEFRKQWKDLAKDKQAELHRAVTMASLVEKETAIPQERPMVAAVFYNRLRSGMPLQCDPTTVYAALLENRYKGVIHKSDLASTNAYNTYAHAGLPPGPIANPGARSIKASLEPAVSAALYFVAKGDGSGSHRFSNSLSEHLSAVTSYRKTQQQR